MSGALPTPKWLECWKSAEEKDPTIGRQRWLNRASFIIASVGAAVGLGNFWRFPFITYKNGGG